MGWSCYRLFVWWWPTSYLWPFSNKCKTFWSLSSEMPFTFCFQSLWRLLFWLCSMGTLKWKVMGKNIWALKPTKRLEQELTLEKLHLELKSRVGHRVVCLSFSSTEEKRDSGPILLGDNYLTHWPYWKASHVTFIEALVCDF